MHKVLAIVGMCGSGKSVACEFLEKRKYRKVYFGGVTLDKLKEAGLEINPVNEKMMREKLRRELGMGAYAKILLPKIEELSEEGDVVLDGLYSWEELSILREKLKNFYVIAIICDKDIRYERLSRRSVRPLTKEEAIQRDLAEIENINKAGPIAYADFYIDNNKTLRDYEERLQEIIGVIQ